jgi:hypothetical protein
MLTQKDKDMSLNFLKTNYPVVRMKEKDRFKRAIVTDGGFVFYLNDKNVYKKIKVHLNYSLKIVFDMEYQTAENLLDEYFGL